jgi:flagellin
MQLTATANRDSALINTIANAQSFLQTQNGALQVATSIVDRISQLVAMSRDVTLTSTNIANYDTEFSQLQSELKTIIGAQYNGISLFATNDTAASMAVLSTNDLSTTNAIAIQKLNLGDTSWGTSSYPYTGPNGTSGALGTYTNIHSPAGIGALANRDIVYLTPFSSSLAAQTTTSVSFVYSSSNGVLTLSPATGASSSVSAVTAGGVAGYTSLTSISASDISNFVNTIATFSAINGAEQSRLNFASQLATNDRTSLQSANSSISDTDIAQATTALAKWNVLVQAGTSMLTQANNSAQTVLKLITG